MKRLFHSYVQNAYCRPSFLRRCRIRRMQQFLRLVSPPSDARIIDLGGSTYNWSLISHQFRITIVNLPGASETAQDPRMPSTQMVEADATDLSGVFDDFAFDVVFSNSVIEHVGDDSKQEAFAREVKRLAIAHWIQTPAETFPVEPHTRVPFYWKLSESRRHRMIAKWSVQYPKWAAGISNTRVLARHRMEQLFPQSRIVVERVLGLAKSYVAVSRWPSPLGSSRSSSAPL